MERPLATNGNAWRLDNCLALPVEAAHFDEVSIVCAIMRDELSYNSQLLCAI